MQMLTLHKNNGLISFSYVMCTINSIPFFSYFVTYGQLWISRKISKNLEKYAPHSFDFLENDYLHHKLSLDKF